MAMVLCCLLLFHRRRIMQELLTIDETARVLKLKPKTLRNWIGMRKIPFKKIGRCVRFDSGSLEAWMKRKEVEESEVWQ